MKGFTMGMRAVVLAALAIFILGIGIMLLTGKFSVAGKEFGKITGDSKCTIKKTEYTRACNCEASGESGVGGETDRAANIKDQAQNMECDWAMVSGQNLACPDVC